MKSLKKLFTSSNFWPLFVVFIFAVLAARSLIFQSGYFNMHDDLQLMRQLELEKCFLDGQIPCRWVPDMGYGFGFPLFNFYPPLPYLIGETFRVLGYSFINAVKLNFALSFLVSGVAMYFLAKKFFGPLGGVLSAIFYIWAPYHAVDVYVRGAMNEAWALSSFPLIFLFAYKLTADNKSQITKNVILLALSYFGLLTSHNLMVLIFTPFLGFWVLLHLWQKKAWTRLPSLAISGIWALGLAAFFTLPALNENNFTWIRSQLQGYYDYTAHFVSLHQLLISRFWGYGPSVWIEAQDGMSFQIGHLHWILSIFVGLLLLARLLLKKGNIIKRFKDDPLLLTTTFLLAVGWFSAYLTHLRSIWIYKLVPQLSYIQFPWRFLTITIFAFSFVIGVIPGIISAWKKKKHWIVKLLVTPHELLWAFVLVVILLILNWGYFRPEGGRMGALTDEEKFTGAAWELQQTAGIYDYLPIQAEMAPTGPQETLAEVMQGEGEISSAEQGTYWGLFNADIASEEALVRINIFDFPGWRVFVKEGANSEEIETFVPEEEKWGRMWVKLSKGEHLVYAQIFNTPVRTAGNLISLVSWSLLLTYPVWRRGKMLKFLKRG